MTGRPCSQIRLETVRGVPRATATGPLGPDEIALLQAHSDRKLVLCYVDGWTGEPLDFLQSLPNLRMLLLLVNRPLDVSPISSLAKLESLEILCPTSGSIQFGGLQQLKSCSLRWQHGMKRVLEATQLESLEIEAYPGHDLSPFQSLRSLRSLQLRASRLWTTRGVSSLARLRTFDVRGCRKLESLCETERLLELEELNVEGCSKLMSLAPALRLPRLRRLMAGDCPRLATLAGVEQLAALEEIYLDGSTRIADDDLAPLLQVRSLRKLCIHWRDSYSPPASEFAGLRP